MSPAVPSDDRAQASDRTRRALIILAVALAFFATDARAQSEAAIALGLSVASYDPIGQPGAGTTAAPAGVMSTNGMANLGPVLRVRFGPGFGPAIGFGWHSLGVQTVAGGDRIYLGKLRVRPVMAGIGYSWNRGKWWLEGSVVGGYAFNHLKVNDRARPAARSALGATFVSFDVGNGLTWRSQAGVWYDVASRIGVGASIGYFGMRPMLTTTSDVGITRTRLDAACTVLSLGLAYGVF